MLGIMKDASSTSGELASAGSEHVHGVRNAGAGDPQRRRPWGGAGAGGARGGGRRPGTWERELVEDASSTSGELANAASEHIHGVRNAGEAIRGLPALFLDEACSASPPPQRRPPSPPRHAKWALTPAHGPELGA